MIFKKNLYLLQIGQQNLYEPIKYSSEEFACPICGKIMNSNLKMETHIRVHTGEKPFQCLICNYSTNDKSNHRRHMFKHHGCKM